MKILLIHGENIITSRERLTNLVAQYKSKNWGVVKIDKTDKESASKLTTNTLFETSRLNVIEDLVGMGVKFLDWLSKNHEKYDSNLIIWNEGNLNLTLLNNLPKLTKIEKFDLPKTVFKFLDSFYPGNAKANLNYLHNLKKTEPIEFVFAVLAKHIKDLYWVKTDLPTLDYPSWRKNKLKYQTSYFKLKTLKNLINELADVDIKSKTTDTSLLEILDLIIVKNLE